MGTHDDPVDLPRVASFSCHHKPIDAMANVFDAPSDMAVFHIHRIKPSMFTARTPSIASDLSSSWTNEQAAVLQRSTSSQAKLSGGAFGKRWFDAFARPCSTSKSVSVHQSIRQGDPYAFPVIMNPAMEILTAKKEAEKVEDLPRMSLEVFGSGSISKGDIARNLVRKMSILTWDAIPKSKESVICDDIVSEASSDLFEIENISRTGWDPSEATSCVMSPSTQYAPSEASIEWSVATASAADFASVYDDKQTVYNNITSSIQTHAKTKIEPTKKFRANGLLGCKSYKSVEVAEPVYRSTDKSKY